MAGYSTIVHSVKKVGKFFRVYRSHVHIILFIETFTHS